MDDAQREAEGLKTNSSHAAPGGDAGTPAPFTPLRLVLLPGEIVVELAHPDMLVGRHSEADVRLPLPDVSRHHCRFTFHDGTWYVRDLKSLNGTFVNEQPIEYASVRHGDTIRIGGFHFEVDLSGSAKGTVVLHRADCVLSSIYRALGGRPEVSPSQRKVS